jgi:hypothetical protein
MMGWYDHSLDWGPGSGQVRRRSRPDRCERPVYHRVYKKMRAEVTPFLQTPDSQVPRCLVVASHGGFVDRHEITPF